MIDQSNGIEEFEVAGLFGCLDHRFSQTNGALATLHPVGADDGVFSASFEGSLADQFHFGRGIVFEGVDRHHHVDAEFLGVADVVLQVAKTSTQQVQVLFGVGSRQRATGDDFRSTAVHLEGAHRGDHHHHLRDQTGVAALDIHEFFHADVSAKARFGDDVIGQLEGDAVGDDRAVAMGDIGKRTGVDEDRRAFEGLHQGGLDGVFHQDGHGASHTQVFGSDGFALAC